MCKTQTREVQQAGGRKSEGIAKDQMRDGKTLN